MKLGDPGLKLGAMRTLAAFGVLLAATLLSGYGGVRISDGFAMLLLFGAIAIVGVGGVIGCIVKREEAKVYVIPAIMAVVGVMGCAAALDGR